MDDNATLLENYAELLRFEGYAVELAFDGKEALQKIAARKPDLVMTDVYMPELGGYELLEAIRANPELVGLPVILLTASQASMTAERARELGCSAFLTKPSPIDQILETIRRLFAEVDR